jgi:hypothetical protein
MPTNLLNLRTLRGTLTLFIALLSVSLYAQLDVSIDGEDITCFGLSSGSATAQVANGVAPFTYVWSNGGSAATINNLNAGSYGVTVTDDNGLTGTASVTLTQPTRVTATISDPVECSAPFTIGAEPEGGLPPYHFNWSTGADTRAVSVPAGDYCVTVVDDNLCGYVACTTVEEDPPSVTLVDIDLLCNGVDEGAITANPDGGVAPYSYLWSNGGTTRTISNLSPGNYSVTLTDALGCTATATGNISEPPVITGSISGDNTVCQGVADAFLLINPSGGTPPYSYNWSPGNFSGQGLGPLGAGVYSVTVTDANECTIVRSFVILASDPVNVEIEGDEILCGTNTGTLMASPVNGPVSQYTYVWNTGSTSPTITNVTAGNYSVTATDVNGCTDVATATVTSVDLDLDLSSTPTSCSDGDDGTATATVTGGQQPYTYAWSNGGNTATITGLTPGVYGVTVTESGPGDCKISGNILVTAPDDLNMMATPFNVVCNGESSGNIDVDVSGGTQPYTYLWNTGAVSEDLFDVPAGNYSPTVTDANGCTASLNIVISEPAELNVNGTVTNVACDGDAGGQIVLTVSGGVQPYSFDWNNGATSQTITNLVAGDYTVTVTDANNCRVVETYTVTEPPAIIVTGIVTDVLCAGDNDGAIDLSASGGSGNFSYLWSNNATSQDLAGVPAGDYSVTVTDANECSETASFVINEPPAIVLSVTPRNLECNGDNSGSIEVVVSGGTPGYIVRLNNAVVASPITGLAAGTYIISVADANGCAGSTTVIISEPAPFTVTSQVTPVACPGEATGAINLTVSGATPSYSFAWSNNAVTEDLTGLVEGDYTVTITDNNNCTYTETFTIGTNGVITITGTVSPAECNGEASGDIDVTVSGGSGTYSYIWSNNATSQDLVNVSAGSYSVTVMDANGCDAVASFVVTQPDEIELTSTTPSITCGGTETGTVTVFPTGGTGPYTYIWNNGDTGMTLSEVGAGAYIVTVTDANGCTDVTSGIILSELPELTCEITVNQEATNGNNGSISVEVDGGTIPYAYVWDDNSTSPDRSNLSAGTYSVTVTDGNNCTTECSVTLQAFAGIGDFVWEDWNVDGQQDPDEPGIADYPVYLKNAAGVIIDSTRTDADGFYSFTGLIPGNYSILFPPAPGGIRTLFNTGDDTSDNDADPDLDGMTQVYNLSPGEFDMTVDAGFFAEPGGTITDPCVCLNNNTTDEDGQFSELFEVTANPGQTWTIVSVTNAYLFNSDNPPVPPILVPAGTIIPQVGIDMDDPSLAFYSLEIRLVDEQTYTVTITNGAFTITFSNTCIYPVVELVNFPSSPVCQFDAAVVLEGTGTVPGDIVFTVDGIVTEIFDPLALGVGTYLVQAQLFPDDESECLTVVAEQILIVENCPAKLGDFVWEDSNINGIQDPGEPGIPNVQVIVTSQDGSYMDTTFTDANGMYMFSVDPGTYKMTFEQPEDYVPTSTNSGSNDELDSDMNPSTFMTPFYTVGPDEMDFSIDAGFINPCLDNIDNPGTIASDQEICGPGNVPNPFVELTPATGGVGNIQYLWMWNTEDEGQDISFWQPIPNSNSPNFAPGPVFETTFFTRCVRRDNCPYLESNVLTVEVGDVAVADISGPTSICVGEEATFQALNPGNASVAWNFTGSSSVESATGTTVSTEWATFGSFSVTLTVVRDGCTSTQTRNISVINTPSRCGGNLLASGSVDNLVNRDVTIEWEVPSDGVGYEFELERSVDGVNFTSVAQVGTPVFTSSNDMEMYRQEDVSPLAGRTFYRVRLIDAAYGDMMSNVVEMQLAGASTMLGRIFPNPANGGMIHVEMTEEAAQADAPSVQLYDVRGNVIGARRYLSPGTGVINLDAQGQPAGMYFIRLTVGDRTETHRVILE